VNAPDAFAPAPDLAALGRRYDGPIPTALLEAALWGPALLAAGRTAAESRLFDRLARHAGSAIARHRQRGRNARVPPELAYDLLSHRRVGLAWYRRARELGWR